MKKIILSLLVIGLGVTGGSILNSQTTINSAYASSSCENLTCENDRVGGFRCFSNGYEYNCDDSNYPSCSESSCNDPSDPIEN